MTDVSSLPPERPLITALFRGGWNGAGGMVHIYNRAFHRRAADWYVRQYYREHDDWPRGKHVFKVRFGKGEGFDVQTPIGDGTGTRTVSMIFEVHASGELPPNAVSEAEGILHQVSL